MAKKGDGSENDDSLWMALLIALGALIAWTIKEMLESD